MSIKTITKQGLKIERKFTRQGINPLEEVEYETKSSKITEPDGTIIFQMDNIEAPKSWSQLAIDIAASKYFKRAQVPTPEGRETSVKQMVSRVSSTIRQFGEENNYFETKEDAQAFEDELNYMLINQMGAFNSPVWFNVGLFHKYGIIGNKPGTYFYNLKTDQVEECEDSYSHPQASACFIQKIEDSLDSIYELITNESKIFKFGSGTGTNFSSLRGVEEPLSGGGKSSGLMSYLRILDRSAAAVKSGGITRRAAKMCVLDMDHPEIEDYIMWKVK
ncbi:MAG: vitamin B12-dependent ribonucleotide reductase, partial [Nanoarchaeota archaeon]